MKFDRLLKRKFVLLEQDAQGQPPTDPNAAPAGAPPPPQAPAPADDKSVQNSEEALLEVAKKLILCFKQITEANDIKERDSLIQDLMKASVGPANTALQAIGKVCDEYSPQAIPQQM